MLLRCNCYSVMEHYANENDYRFLVYASDQDTGGLNMGQRYPLNLLAILTRGRLLVCRKIHSVNEHRLT